MRRDKLRGPGEAKRITEAGEGHIGLKFGCLFRTEKNNDERQLKDETEGETEPRHESEILAHGNERREQIGAEFYQKIERKSRPSSAAWSFLCRQYNQKHESVYL